MDFILFAIIVPRADNMNHTYNTPEKQGRREEGKKERARLDNVANDKHVIGMIQ
jgi:hypothetical protein